MDRYKSLSTTINRFMKIVKLYWILYVNKESVILDIYLADRGSE